MKSFFTILLILTCSISVAQKDSTSTRSKFFHIDHAKLQFAGEIGFLSGGVGTEFFKNRNAELDLMLGYLPQSVGGVTITTIAIKFTYIPWEFGLFNNQLIYKPLTLGAIAYHALGKELNKQRNRDLYPKGYYWWTIGTRLGPIFGMRFKKPLKTESKIKSISLCIEFGTNDLFIYSWGVNSSVVPLHKIINTSIGLKTNF